MEDYEKEAKYYDLLAFVLFGYIRYPDSANRAYSRR
jgi:hypothetical protein